MLRVCVRTLIRNAKLLTVVTDLGPVILQLIQQCVIRRSPIERRQHTSGFSTDSTVAMMGQCPHLVVHLTTGVSGAGGVYYRRIFAAVTHSIYGAYACYLCLLQVIRGLSCPRGAHVRARGLVLVFCDMTRYARRMVVY